MTEGFTPEQEKVLEKIEKLLNLAAKNSNEAEAASAAAKAQELLEEYNLSTAALERRSGGSGKRMQEEVEGGFYRYQRDLWKEVARLNFCRHWIQKVHVPREQRVRNVRFKRRHVLVGRQVNVRTTINIANYLLASVERLTRDVCEEKKLGHLSGWAMSFREGAVYRLTERLEERRQKRIDEEEKKAREAWERASKSGVSLETALTISTLTRDEDDLNRDFISGDEPGTTAKERAEDAAERRAAEEAYTRWAAENPEEAKAKEEREAAEHEKLMKRYRGRGGSGRDDRFGHIDHGAFWAGHKQGDGIGLDPQTSDKNRTAGRLK